MDPKRIAHLLREGQHDEAAALITQYTVPLVASLTSDRIVHDLAIVDVLSGSFRPAGSPVMVDVDASFAFLGWARGALLLYVGQPKSPGARLYDSGGVPLEGVQVYPVASLSGEAAWAETTHRRLVLEVDPSLPVTWQLVPAIIGASDTVAIPAPRRVTITPDGTKAFVSSPGNDTVTPIVLGRPGYTYDHRLKALDVARPPVVIAGTPTYLSCDDGHVVVSSLNAAGAHVTVISAATDEVVLQATIPGGTPLGSAITPDGKHALVGSGAGILARIDLDSHDVETIDLGGRIQAVAVLPDGSAVYAADAASATLYRISPSTLTVEAEISLGSIPHAVEVAPDGQVWVLCRPEAPVHGRLAQIDPATDRVVNDYELPFPEPNDFAIVPVEGQTFETVRTAWVVYEGGRFSEFYIGGTFAGEVHSIHRGSLADGMDAASAVAVNDFGEIWVVQPELDRVWKWPGGRFFCRADRSRLMNGSFFGEYIDVSVYGALEESANE